MKNFNITAQAYNKLDNNKQTLLINESIVSTNENSAKDFFKLNLITNNMVLIKILSVEEY